MRRGERGTSVSLSASALSAQLFAPEIEDQALLSVHLLGKPTAAQLARLHADKISGGRAMRDVLMRLSGSSRAMLDRIKPIEIERPTQFMPMVYLDTTRSRRHLERSFAIPFRRPPETPSRDWRFLRHDVSLVDELISFELTARGRGDRFGYESHYDREGERIYPAVTISDGELTHTLRPQPDKTLIYGAHRLIIEHDCGEETIELGHIMRDATIGRKHLVYDQLHRSGAYDRLGWGRVLHLFIIDAKKRTQTGSRKRIKRCVETLPASVDPRMIYFMDRQSFIAAGDDVSDLAWLRGDGVVTTLPCFGAPRRASQQFRSPSGTRARDRLGRALRREILMTETEDPKTAEIRRLNDLLRTTGEGNGMIVVTAGVQGRGEAFVSAAATAVQRFDAFTPDNDPHGEHDFGALDVDGERLFFKVDYFDMAMTSHSSDPADPAVTRRVLTVMLASEY